eukprot:TRINITY_DN25008_c0_g1_i1.p1 TRINITY_DN25008_c0_g1~~TRINITY_DN25008_c0_g1_i1.p1  ORF type:complete len:958 (-),score=145.44 TRINITY_DN25008_c0_g1_i1:23-2896(-)
MSSRFDDGFAACVLPPATSAVSGLGSACDAQGHQMSLRASCRGQHEVAFAATDEACSERAAFSSKSTCSRGSSTAFDCTDEYSGPTAFTSRSLAALRDGLQKEALLRTVTGSVGPVAVGRGSAATALGTWPRFQAGPDRETQRAPESRADLERSRSTPFLDGKQPSVPLGKVASATLQCARTNSPFWTAASGARTPPPRMPASLPKRAVPAAFEGKAPRATICGTSSGVVLTSTVAPSKIIVDRVCTAEQEADGSVGSVERRPYTKEYAGSSFPGNLPAWGSKPAESPYPFQRSARRQAESSHAASEHQSFEEKGRGGAHHREERGEGAEKQALETDQTVIDADLPISDVREKAARNSFAREIDGLQRQLVTEVARLTRELQASEAYVAELVAEVARLQQAHQPCRCMARPSVARMSFQTELLLVRTLSSWSSLARTARSREDNHRDFASQVFQTPAGELLEMPRTESLLDVLPVAVEESPVTNQQAAVHKKGRRFRDVKAPWTANQEAAQKVERRSVDNQPESEASMNSEDSELSGQQLHLQSLREQLDEKIDESQAQIERLMTMVSVQWQTSKQHLVLKRDRLMDRAIKASNRSKLASAWNGLKIWSLEQKLIRSLRACNKRNRRFVISSCVRGWRDEVIEAHRRCEKTIEMKIQRFPPRLTFSLMEASQAWISSRSSHGLTFVSLLICAWFRQFYVTWRKLQSIMAKIGSSEALLAKVCDLWRCFTTIKRESRTQHGSAFSPRSSYGSPVRSPLKLLSPVRSPLKLPINSSAGRGTPQFSSFADDEDAVLARFVEETSWQVAPDATVSSAGASRFKIGDSEISVELKGKEVFGKKGSGWVPLKKLLQELFGAPQVMSSSSVEAQWHGMPKSASATSLLSARQEVSPRRSSTPHEIRIASQRAGGISPRLSSEARQTRASVGALPKGLTMAKPKATMVSKAVLPTRGRSGGSLRR